MNCTRPHVLGDTNARDFTSSWTLTYRARDYALVLTPYQSVSVNTLPVGKCSARVKLVWKTEIRILAEWTLRRVKKVKWSRYTPGVAQRVGRGIALLFHDRGTRKGWVVSSTPRPHFNPGKDPVPILQEAGCAPGPVWMGGKSRPRRDSIPDRPAHSQLLYRLSYPPTYCEGYCVRIIYTLWIRNELVCTW